MEHAAGRAPHQLSMGERRRVAIAGVLAMDPRLLVLDEPSANLDPRARRELLDVLAALDRTLLVVTHDLPFAAELCERAVILSGGRIVADGPTRAILADAELLAAPRPGAAGRLRPGPRPPALTLYAAGMADVAMPRLSDSMEEGTILKWLKSDGDEISRGDELVEIETDKANMTYEADEAGALQIVAKEGDTLAVGETIATIGGGSAKPAEDAGGEQEPAAEEAAPEEEPADDAPPPDRSDVPTAEDSAPESEQADEEAPVATADEQVDQPAGDGNGRVKASPIARRMAAELGVELSGLTGSGPGGRIVKSDVQAAAKNGAPAEEAPAEQEEARPTEPAPEAEAAKPAARSGDATTGKGETTIEELTRLQQTIARRMAESKATAPEFVLTLEVDMGEAVEFRKQLKAAAGDNPPPSFNDFVVKASALALQRVPARQRRLPRRQVRALLADQRRHRGRGPGRAHRPDDLRRRPQVARRDLARRARPGRQGPRRQDQPARALGRHVQRLEPRHVRHQALHRGDQPAAGRDPRGRRDDAAPGRRRGRGRRAADHGAHALLRPPDPLRRRRRAVPRPHPRAAREPVLRWRCSSAPLAREYDGVSSVM